MKKLSLRNARTQSQWLVAIIRGQFNNDFLFQVKGDPDFPYVGKHVVNLTLAQIKTLDCGSKRQLLFRELPEFHKILIPMITFFGSLALQLTYPGTRISTLDELFEFAHCADPKRVLQWNIESKINPMYPSSTRGVNDFVTLQHQAFLKSGYKLSQITVGESLLISPITNSNRILVSKLRLEDFGLHDG